MAETAIALPLFLMAALAIVQFALFSHAQNVVTAAVQDGARVAAADNRSVADGVAHARALMRAGLDEQATPVDLRATDAGDAVVLEAQGRLRTIIPWVGDSTLPLVARAVVSKERFRPGVGG